MNAAAEVLELDVVAEGVETTQQRDFLRARDCRRAQGQLFSLPVSARDCEGYLRRHTPAQGSTGS
jgi:EAL domain-containing protein (putative c-di-GMP-specific phosphodiesterase class I)